MSLPPSKPRHSVGESEALRLLNLKDAFPRVSESLPPGSGTSIFTKRNGWRRILDFLGIGLVLFVCSCGDWKYRGIPRSGAPGEPACAMNNPSGIYTCIADERAFLCVANYDTRLLECAPYPHR